MTKVFANLKFSDSLNYELRKNTFKLALYKSHILTIYRNGPCDLSNLNPFLITSTADIVVQKEVLKKGNKRILQHEDEVFCLKMPDIKFKFFDNRQLFKLDPNIAQKYYASKQFLDGHTEHVFLVQDVIAPKKKMILKKIKNRAENSLANEAKLMLKLKHPNIVKLLHVHKFEFESFLLIEYMDGIDLIHHVKTFAGQFLPEAEAKFCFYQIANGLNYLHSQNIAHRDLKAENVFVRNCKGKALCKIGDFGLSNYDNGVTDFCGSFLYSAPEEFAAATKPYSSKKSDMWSLGVILFCILCGRFPYYGRGMSDVRNAIINQPLAFKQDQWKNISFYALNMITRLLKIVPSLRYTVEEVLAHAWFKDDKFLKNIASLQKSSDQEENKSIPISSDTAKTQVVNDKKRKIPLSVSNFFCGKRQKI